MDLYRRREWLSSDAVGTVRRTASGRIDRCESRAIHAILTKTGWVLQDRKARAAFYGS